VVTTALPPRGPGLLPPTLLAGDRTALGGLNCDVACNGPPLALVHCIHAAPATAEMRPIFEHSRATHTAYAVDLPGFGLSDRSDRRDGIDWP